ncbi:MAG: hypothetical protein ACFFBD_00890 [Candidatus Hodarchaeota archaeon]
MNEKEETRTKKRIKEEKTMSQEVCSVCGYDILVHEPTHTVCARCGVVQDSKISYEQKRAFTKEEEATLQHGKFEYIPGSEKGVGLPRGHLKRDSKGNYLSADQREMFRRLTRREAQSTETTERKTKMAVQRVESIREHLSIPFSVVQLAMKIHNKALQEEIGNGRSPEAMIAAALIIALKKLGQNISEQDILEYINASLKEVRYCMRIIRFKLGIKYIPTDLRKLCFDTAQCLNLTIFTASRAMKILQKAEEAGITMGKNPRSLVGAAVYMAAVQTGERRTQAQVAKAAKTTSVTIRSRTKKLSTKLNMEIKPSRGVGALPVYVQDSRELMNK